VNKTPCIPMTKHHQELILDGRKTTTLRAKLFEAGVYRMFSRGAGSLGYLRVTKINDEQVIPGQMDAAKLRALAWAEGYEYGPELLACMRQLRLNPDKPYWLHTIEPCGAPADN